MALRLLGVGWGSIDELYQAKIERTLMGGGNLRGNREWGGHVLARRYRKNP
jgi:hypothetical protein